MKITKLETIFVRPRWLFLKMHTDEGIVGLGEPVVEGRSQTVAAAVHEIGRYLIGQDPTRIEHHWQAIFRGQFYRGGPVLTSALSGIEHAMWDITGKWLGQPVYKLLGGAVRDRIRVYGWLDDQSYGDYVEQAVVGARAGFTAFKLGVPGAVNIVDTRAKVDEIVEHFARFRDALGPEIDIGIDFHGRVSPAMAVRLAQALEPLYPFFIEEPVLPENVDALATVARSTSIPIATGERSLHQVGLSRSCSKNRPRPSCSPTWRTRAAYWRCARSRPWPSAGTRPSRRTVRWDRSPWPPACSSTPARRISWCRSTSLPARAI